MRSKFKKYLLEITHSSEVEEVEVIQSLWSGYGKISRYQLTDSPHKTVVVKSISLHSRGAHPRGWSSANSHNRKVKSYEVETHWYKNWNQRCNSFCKTPTFLGSFSEEKHQWIVLEDLNEEFPVLKNQLAYAEVKVCLKWLANFHARFINEIPEGLWQVGTYWHLDTRPDELEKLENQELKAKAHLIDEQLNNCQFQTIVHGDAKLANFCFSADGNDVAAVDFQYIGGGCGMKDVAYFLGSCLSSDECEIYESELLDFYFSELEHALKINGSEVSFEVLHRQWRKMYSLACADFTRFMLGWMPSHQKMNKYNLDILSMVLSSL